jgi:dihydrolipoamide dehydrogenase
LKITVIGGGPGGYEAALYAAKKGAEVVLVEKDKVGGTCLNRGCIPTKAFLASYDAMEAVKTADKFGLNGVGDPTPDYPAILARKNKIMTNLVKGIEALEKANNVELIKGTGCIKDKNTVEVTKEDGSTESVTTDYIILATGSVPVCPPVFKVDRKRVITSDEILDFDHAPESLVLVGGGVIGCEIGQFLAKMGTQVTIVEALPRLMATMDEDVSKQIARQFKKEKIKMVTGDGIAEVNPADDHVDVKLSSGKELSAEYVLVAIGRAPYVEGAGLENVGIEMAERGRVKVNEFCQTNVDNIYAIGDIIPTAQLAHVATKEGFIAVDNIFGDKKAATYHAVPGCVFTNPQLASVGTLESHLERDGKEKGKDYKTGTFDFKTLGKAQASGHIAGFVKVIVDMNDVLIGAEIVGANASDMLQVLTTAIQLKLTVEQVLDSIFPHPTMCEAIMEALHDVHGLSTNKL